MNILNLKLVLYSHSWQAVRFLLVGGVATLIHLIVAEAFIGIDYINNIYIINFLSFLVAFLFSYFGHKYITFSKSGSLLRFFMVAVLGFVVNNLLLKLGLIVGIDKKISIGIAIISVPIMTYLFSKLWVFK